MRIVTQYDSEKIAWGGPDQQMQRLLQSAGLTITDFDAGTNLTNGQRDVEFGVEGPLEVLAAVLNEANDIGTVTWYLYDPEMADELHTNGVHTYCHPLCVLRGTADKKENR